MILFDFRYQDPWAEENFTLPDFVQQSQAQQRQDQQAQINRKTLDVLIDNPDLYFEIGSNESDQRDHQLAGRLQMGQYLF